VSDAVVSDAVNCGVTLYLQRDDLSSFDLSGNNVRKLEFLLGEALLRGCDSVVTTGALQWRRASWA
jgi:1-aminocyclopropane-1-carboxylate deaminase/D-cysteine desulfhydrase-like pyridoxal-dependent ACC family enzyme